MEKFIPYVPDPLAAWYIFEKNKELDVKIQSILDEAKDEQAMRKLWYEHLSNNLIFPFNAMVQCPIETSRNNTVSTRQSNMVLQSMAPIERCTAQNMILLAATDKSTFDLSFHIFIQDIRSVRNAAATYELLTLHRYWLYFYP